MSITSVRSMVKVVGNKHEVKSNIPFYFNENNSDITIIDATDTGNITFAVYFGTGKGWAFLE